MFLVILDFIRAPALSESSPVVVVVHRHLLHLQLMTRLFGDLGPDASDVGFI